MFDFLLDVDVVHIMNFMDINTWSVVHKTCKRFNALSDSPKVLSGVLKNELIKLARKHGEKSGFMLPIALLIGTIYAVVYSIACKLHGVNRAGMPTVEYKQLDKDSLREITSHIKQPVQTTNSEPIISVYSNLYEESTSYIGLVKFLSKMLPVILKESDTQLLTKIQECIETCKQ